MMTPVFAQDGMIPSAVVTLDRIRLFEDSLVGRAILQQVEAASADLIAENRRLEAALEAEERALTERRANLPTDEFRELAREFDTRVEELRVAQEAKSRALTRARDAEQQRFFEAAVPVLAELMQDLGAVAIIDRSAVILSFDRIDITDQAIARLDAELGQDVLLEPVPEPESGPESGPADDPASPAPVPAQP
ncbi:MAG: OmpH family outer membrane protein [Pseudotabrizicola sp.]|nr:OmpH family outer membrane protein [Pseudotabrizicola sp.]MDZ7576268.1 OmpH family outer membrane protein [Pseudotabrizicola sp.]